MKARYDFSAATKNPYAKRLKRSVTIRLDESTVEYFRELTAEVELPYQSLVNLYLRDWWRRQAVASRCRGGPLDPVPYNV